MRRFNVYRICRVVERYTISAETIEEARAIWDNGEANLRDAETTDIYEETVIDTHTDTDITVEFFADADGEAA